VPIINRRSSVRVNVATHGTYRLSALTWSATSGVLHAYVKVARSSSTGSPLSSTPTRFMTKLVNPTPTISNAKEDADDDDVIRRSRSSVSSTTSSTALSRRGTEAIRPVSGWIARTCRTLRATTTLSPHPPPRASCCSGVTPKEREDWGFAVPVYLYDPSTGLCGRCSTHGVHLVLLLPISTARMILTGAARET
jgi:hypothetical protein